jgi:hypothetical protein
MELAVGSQKQSSEKRQKTPNDPKKNPLRTLTEEERNWLERISRSQTEPAAHVAHAKEILAVAEGHSYTEAAQIARKNAYSGEFVH